ncbi:MAG: transketolase [candidate division FCPU426 bacterium]
MVSTLQRDPAAIAKLALTLRRDIVEMLGAAGSGHTGGSLSCADILATLFTAELRYDPANPKWPQRDRFILSKGHAAPALYAVLARSGFFSPDHLRTLRKLNSILQGHPDMNKTPGVEMSTGSLGQGLSVGCGMAAMAFDAARRAAYRVYVLLGDGELNEGQVWEAAMSAAHHRLGNLCAVIDRNGLQIDGETCSVMNTDPLDEKWRAFGWNVIPANGHDYRQLLAALEVARAETQRPSVIIAQTVKGKGVSFTENQACWHGIAPDQEQVCQALDELK